MLDSPTRQRFLEPSETNPFLILKPPVIDKRIRDRLITGKSFITTLVTK